MKQRLAALGHPYDRCSTWALHMKLRVRHATEDDDVSEDDEYWIPSLKFGTSEL